MGMLPVPAASSATKAGQGLWARGRQLLSAGILIIIPVAVIIAGVSAAIPIITAAGIVTA